MGGMNGGANNAPFNNSQMQQLNSNDAYDRQPVNPNRQRGRKPRAPDYRYL
jgi:protein MPE1